MVRPFSPSFSPVSNGCPLRNATVDSHTATDALGPRGHRHAPTTYYCIQSEKFRRYRRVRHVSRVGKWATRTLLLRDRCITPPVCSPVFHFSPTLIGIGIQEQEEGLSPVSPQSRSPLTTLLLPLTAMRCDTAYLQAMHRRSLSRRMHVRCSPT